MVVKSFSATSHEALIDLVNNFTENLKGKYTITWLVVPAHNFTVTDDHSGVRREVFAKEYFVAMIQY